jgi:D-tyrosyl-tRNA(Tyr) deacylase
VLYYFGELKKGDTVRDADVLIKKIVNLRIFSDSSGKMNKSIQEISGQILLVSQFTLLANTSKGNRPSFIEAEDPINAEHLLSYVSKELTTYAKVAEGKFGAYMNISLENDGPVTIILESENGQLKL